MGRVRRITSRGREIAQYRPRCNTAVALAMAAIRRRVPERGAAAPSRRRGERMRKTTRRGAPFAAARAFQRTVFGRRALPVDLGSRATDAVGHGECRRELGERRGRALALRRAGRRCSTADWRSDPAQIVSCHVDLIARRHGGPRHSARAGRGPGTCEPAPQQGASSYAGRAGHRRTYYQRRSTRRFDRPTRAARLSDRRSIRLADRAA